MSCFKDICNSFCLGLAYMLIFLVRLMALSIYKHTSYACVYSMCYKSFFGSLLAFL